MRRHFISQAFALMACLATGGPALAATSCQSQDFGGWLQTVRQEAAGKGISARAINASLDGVAFDQGIVNRDRGQGVFRQSFEQFSARMINPRLARGKTLMLQYASLLSRIEAQYGVPGEVLIAIWGLETSYGAVNGNFPTIRALASLAYDCRRSEKFRGELFDAMRLVDRGDLSPGAMRGAWAGELGQTQFMPSSYLKYAVGGRDLIHSVPDVLASTANYLKGYGWSRGAGWEPGQANFSVIKQWNASDVYARTIAAFATRLK
jgi:lytic murein transglycosylase